MRGLALAALAALAVHAGAAPPPAGYEVARTAVPRETLLGADDASWAVASAVEWGPTAYSTRFRAAWNDEGLFLRFDATDPSPWHTMSRRDEHLWEEEVVEIFLDPDRSGRDYYELEINPANVTCDLRMLSPWPDKRGDIDWNLADLATRVHARGGDPASRGWTATAFLPWSGLRALPSTGRVALPPRPGDAWRFNVFRIERPGGKSSPEKDAVFAAWSPPSAKSFHDAGAFRDFVFAAARR
ncbi:MAG TPA: carbohydrate-binding family 9-like protein [Vicinamibacteria bacterium]